MSFLSYLINGISLQCLRDHCTGLHHGLRYRENAELAHGDIIMVGGFVIFYHSQYPGTSCRWWVFWRQSSPVRYWCRD